MTGWPSLTARAAVAVVAGGSAILAFRGTAEVAEAPGAVEPGWGWVVPLVVEAGVLAFALLAWVRSSHGEPTLGHSVVIAAPLALSVVVDIAHAGPGTLLGRVVAAAPPMVLFLAVEGLLSEQRRAAGRRANQPPTTSCLASDGPVGDSSSVVSEAVVPAGGAAWRAPLRVAGLRRAGDGRRLGEHAASVATGGRTR